MRRLPKTDNNPIYKLEEPDRNGSMVIHLDHPNAKGYSIINIFQCRIYMIIVTLKRQRYGSGLLTISESELKKNGCEQVYLQSLHDATSFYEYNGYHKDSETSLSLKLVNYKKHL